MQCLPDNLAGRVYYHPTDQGFEERLRKRMAEIAKIKKVATDGWREHMEADRGERE
jgi:putative ATPase